MPSGSLVYSFGQLCGAQLVLSVVERISFFTLFTDMTGHGHAHPVKRSCLSHSRHYATKRTDQVPLSAARNAPRGMIFCRIRQGQGGGGARGSRFDFDPGTQGEHAHMARKIVGNFL